MTEQQKAKIERIGSFLPSGEPTGWLFSSTGTVVGMSLRRGPLPTLYGGYTLEELRSVYESRQGRSGAGDER